jgi:hypothetical protein
VRHETDSSAALSIDARKARYSDCGCKAQRRERFNDVVNKLRQIFKHWDKFAALDSRLGRRQFGLHRLQVRRRGVVEVLSGSGPLISPTRTCL